MFDNKNNIIKSHTLNDLLKNIPNDDINLLNLVIDLDHTIIYAKIFDTLEVLKIKITEFLYSEYYLGKFNILDKTYLIFIRPYFNYFINTISIYFNIYIYTNSNKIYCFNVIELIKKKFNNFKVTKVIHREINNSLIKSLGFLCENIDDLHFLDNISNYDNFIKKTIIIDDCFEVWKYDYKNLINVKKFIIGKENKDDNKIINYYSDTNCNKINENNDYNNDNNDNKTNYSNGYYNIFDNYNFLFFNKNIIKDDILLILSNRLFAIYNLYAEKYKLDPEYNIQELISKYKL